MWYEVRLETQAHCTERVFASTPEEAAAKAIAEVQYGYHHWDSNESEKPAATRIIPVDGMAEHEYINCIKEIMKNIEDAKTYGIPVAQLLLNMKAFCEETMLSPKADEGRKKQMAEWRKLLGYSDDDLDEDD